MKLKEIKKINLLKTKHQISHNKTQSEEIIQLVNISNYDKNSKYKNK